MLAIAASFAVLHTRASLYVDRQIIHIHFTSIFPGQKVNSSHEPLFALPFKRSLCQLKFVPYRRPLASKVQWMRALNSSLGHRKKVERTCEYVVRSSSHRKRVLPPVQTVAKEFLLPR